MSEQNWQNCEVELMKYPAGSLQDTQLFKLLQSVQPIKEHFKHEEPATGK